MLPARPFHRLFLPALLLLGAPSFAEEAPPADAQSPLLLYRAGGQDGFSAKLAGGLRASYLGTQAFATDADQTLVAASPFDTRIRLSPELRYWHVGLIAEADFVTGALTGLPAQSLRLGQSAHPSVSIAELRQLYLEYRGDTFAVRAGQQTSQWGLGLVANGGAQDASPGEFGEAHFGDLTWRAAIAGRPLFGLGGAWRAVEPILAADMIVRDDTANYFDGDRALQGVLALRFNVDADRNFGVYTVYRRQRAAEGDPMSKATDAYVVDFAAKWKWENAQAGTQTKLGAEVAYITGTSTLARSDTAAVSDLRQFGAAVKTSLRVRNWEGYLDFGYASGDQNPYDDKLQSFRFDPDYHAGLILYDEVLGWQSARTYARATDREIVGVPPDGVDLLPSRGSVYGSWYLFPRVRSQVRDWLDVYGGPLFAFATSSMADAYATRVNGGVPTNSLGGQPGRFLGTEVDVGAQARLMPVQGMTATATAELGYLLPGDAFTDASGNTLAPVAAGRIRLSVQF